MKSRIDKTIYTFNKSLSGNKYWYKDGNYYRECDLPAIIYTNGNMYWFENGKLIRKIKK